MTWLSFCARRPGPEWKLSPVQAGVASGADPDHVKGAGIVSGMGMDKAALTLIDITHGAYRWFVNSPIVDSLLQRTTRPCFVRVAVVTIPHRLPYNRHIVPTPSLGLSDICASVFSVVFAPLGLPFFIRQSLILFSSRIREALAVLVIPGSFLFKGLTHNNMVTRADMVTQA